MGNLTAEGSLPADSTDGVRIYTVELLKGSAAMTTRCPAGCGGSLVELDMRLGTGEMVTMQSCSSCDRRWWERDGKSTDIVGLIESMSAEKNEKTGSAATKARPGTDVPSSGGAASGS